MCPSLQEMKVNPSPTVISHSIGNNDILCDISTGSLRPLVPLQLRHKLFIQLHSISHPGVRASKRLISSRFVWPGMSRDVGLWVKIVYFMPKIQDLNSCSFFSFSYSRTNLEIFSRSCGFCWSSSIKPRFYISFHHDRQNYEMARGRSLVLHLS